MDAGFEDVDSYTPSVFHSLERWLPRTVAGWLRGKIGEVEKLMNKGKNEDNHKEVHV